MCDNDNSFRDNCNTLAAATRNKVPVSYQQRLLMNTSMIAHLTNAVLLPTEQKPPPASLARLEWKLQLSTITCKFAIGAVDSSVTLKLWVNASNVSQV
jgi:hypothetical protein